MLPYRDSRFTILLIAAFFAIIGVYAYFEARNAIYGPRIELAEERVATSEQVLSIQGEARNIAELRVNGNPITVTEDGAFSEKHMLAPGYNRIVLEARDAYGRSREHILEVWYTPVQAEARTGEEPGVPEEGAEPAPETAAPEEQESGILSPI